MFENEFFGPTPKIRSDRSAFFHLPGICSSIWCNKVHFSFMSFFHFHLLGQVPFCLFGQLDISIVPFLCEQGVLKLIGVSNDNFITYVLPQHFA